MSSNIPAVFGGTPVRTYPFRTTPEVGQQEIDFVRAQILTADWEPDAPLGGIPVAEGLTLPVGVLESLGAESAALAAEFARMQARGQTVYPVPCDNGTQVIKLALASLAKWTGELGLRPMEVGSEVIVPALTWQATAGAVLDRNMVPRLVDVLDGTLCIDPEAVRAAITDRTVAIIVVHLYDNMAAMEEITKIAEEFGLALIEDCAHAHGAMFDGQGAGTIGHFGTFSFQGSKSLSAQEMGIGVTGREYLADQLCSAVTCGRPVRSSKVLQSGNDRTPGAIAALARSQLLRFGAQNRMRILTGESFDMVVRRQLGDLGLRVSDLQPGVQVRPTYKRVVRIDLSKWGGMSLDQWRAAMEAELKCEIAPTYEPLTDSGVYTPHSDPARRLSETYWEAIDPKRYPAPVADRVFGTTAVIEHAAFLDPEFPERFVEAARKLHRHADRVAGELVVSS